MNDNDQSLKFLLMEFLRQFFELFLPEWGAKFDFDSLEWLQQELFPDPPDGQRRSVDLLGKLKTREPLIFDGCNSDEWLTLLHVEIEGRDSVEVMGRRMLRYYTSLRDKHELPVLPIVVFLHVGLDGIGVATYREDYGFSRDPDSSTSLDVLRFRYLYVGLRALDAVEYLQRGSELGVALAALMKLSSDKRVWFKAEALQRIALSVQSDRLRELLSRFVEIYISLDADEEVEFEQLLARETYEEARIMGTTFVDKGIEQGIEKGIEKGIELGELRLLTRLLEQRFGTLTEGQNAKLSSLTKDQRWDIVNKVMTAGSLAELGLAD